MGIRLTRAVVSVLTGTNKDFSAGFYLKHSSREKFIRRTMFCGTMFFYQGF